MLKPAPPLALLLCLLALVALPAAEADAQVVVARPLAPALGGEFSGLDSQQVADSFTVNTLASVTSLSWYGMYAPPGTGSDTFVVRVFRTDASGGPEAAPAWSWSGQASVQATNETYTWSSDQVVPWWRYSIVLPGWTLEPGTYWLSVVKSGAGSYGWLWADTDQGGRRAYRGGDAGTWDGFAVDDQHHAFTMGRSAGEVVVYSQKSLAGSTGRVPGLYDQLGLLAVDSHRDFYQIFTNAGQEVAINRAVVWGNVQSVSKAVIVPVVPGMANGLAVLVPDRDPAHVLSEATVYPTTPDVFGPITIVFSNPVRMTTGMKLAFGFIVPLERVVDATLFGTDTLPNGLTSDTPPYYTGFYATNGPGTEIGFGVGNHYLEIKSVPPPRDFDGDGETDILWHHQPSGTLYAWFMKGGTKTGGGYLSPISVSADWQLHGVADFNADGKPDVLWHHQPSGALYAWFMDGTTRIGGGYLSPATVSADWQIKGVADFNGDGTPDILWHHQPSGILYAWFMAGTTRIGSEYLTPGSVSAEWQIRQVADFNGDGVADIVFHNQRDGALFAWFMRGTTRVGGGYLTPSTVSTDWQIRQ